MREEGIEPSTSVLSGQRSTTELLALKFISTKNNIKYIPHQPINCKMIYGVDVVFWGKGVPIIAGGEDC